MGMDCHLHIEVNLNDRWEHFEHIILNRDYELFEKMTTCLRWEDGKQLKHTVDMPVDVNMVTLKYLDNVDYHSHSWMSMNEAKRLYRWMENNNCQAQELYKSIYDLLEFYKKEFPVFRLVYAFDN